QSGRSARRGETYGGEARAESLGDRVTLEHVDAVEDVAGRCVHAQVRGNQVEHARAHGAVEAQDLAEHAADRGVALGGLHHRVHVVVGAQRRTEHRALHVPFAPRGRSRSRVRTESLPPVEAASTIPLDSTPISFAASRFATMTTFLPTISAGA